MRSLRAVLRLDAWYAVVCGTGLVWRAWPAGVLALAAPALISAALPTVTLLLIWRLVNLVSAGNPSPASVAAVSLGVAAAIGAQYVVGELSGAISELLGYRVAAHAQEQVLRQSTAVPYRSFYDPAWQDRLARVSEDIEWRLTHLTSLLVRLAASIVGLAGSAALLAMLNAWLAALAVASAIPLVLVQRRNSRTTNTVWKQTSGLFRHMDYLRQLAAAPDRAAEIRAFGLGRHLTHRHGELAVDMIGQMARVNRRNLRWVVLAGVCNAVGLALSYLLLTRGVVGTLSAGDLFLVVTAFGTVSSLVATLFTHAADLEDNGIYLTDLVAVINEPAEDLESGSGRVQPFHGLLLRDVRFRYPAGHLVLDGVSFDIAAGATVALVGENGAGKSTLVKLLLRLLEPDAGTIVVNGLSLGDVPAGPWRSRVAVLFQESGRYEATVRDAVGFGDVDGPDSAQRRHGALADAGAAGFVAALPHGPDTRLGRLFEGAHGLSGGQWQRIALARVLYREADLYILDEPTTGLNGEWEVLQRIRRRLSGRSVLLITHRMAAAAQADHIVMLDGGRVAEQGSHDELMLLGGRYAKMYQAQAEQFARPDQMVRHEQAGLEER